MSCTHDCGCSPEIRDARTDEWVQIVPESARPATLTPEQPVKAPGQGGDIFLTRGTPVEVEWSNGNRLLRYVDEGGYQVIAGHVGDGNPYPWGDTRIVRVLTEDKPASPQEPDLPRQIKPEDVRVGMVVECRDLVRVTAVHGGIIEADRWSEYLHPRGQEFRADAESETCERQWWLVEGAPAPVDPDAAAIEALVKAYRRSPEYATESHHWRLVSVEGGPVTGTFWVQRPRRTGTWAIAVDVTIWDEGRTWGPVLIPGDLSAVVEGGTVDLAVLRPRSHEEFVREREAEIKAAVLAAVAAVEWPADSEAGEDQ